MIGPPIAMPGYFSSPDFAIGSLVVLAFAILLVRATASRKGERDRRAGLGLLAILAGPLAGAALAGLTQVLGHVHPDDVRYTYITFTSIGGIAGFVAGLFFALTSVLSSNNS
jgi:hypothetical protein